MSGLSPGGEHDAVKKTSDTVPEGQQQRSMDTAQEREVDDATGQEYAFKSGDSHGHKPKRSLPEIPGDESVKKRKSLETVNRRKENDEKLPSRQAMLFDESGENKGRTPSHPQSVVLPVSEHDTQKGRHERKHKESFVGNLRDKIETKEQASPLYVKTGATAASTDLVTQGKYVATPSRSGTNTAEEDFARSYVLVDKSDCTNNLKQTPETVEGSNIDPAGEMKDGLLKECLEETESANTDDVGTPSRRSRGDTKSFQERDSKQQTQSGQLKTDKSQQSDPSHVATKQGHNESRQVNQEETKQGAKQQLESGPDESHAQTTKWQGEAQGAETKIGEALQGSTHPGEKHEEVQDDNVSAPPTKRSKTTSAMQNTTNNPAPSRQDQKANIVKETTPGAAVQGTKSNDQQMSAQQTKEGDEKAKLALMTQEQTQSTSQGSEMKLEKMTTSSSFPDETDECYEYHVIKVGDHWILNWKNTRTHNKGKVALNEMSHIKSIVVVEGMLDADGTPYDIEVDQNGKVKVVALGSAEMDVGNTADDRNTDVEKSVYEQQGGMIRSGEDTRNIDSGPAPETNISLHEATGQQAAYSSSMATNVTSHQKNVSDMAAMGTSSGQPGTASHNTGQALADHAATNTTALGSKTQSGAGSFERDASAQHQDTLNHPEQQDKRMDMASSAAANARNNQSSNETTKSIIIWFIKQGQRFRKHVDIDTYMKWKYIENQPSVIKEKLKRYQPIGGEKVYFRDSDKCIDVDVMTDRPDILPKVSMKVCNHIMSGTENIIVNSCPLQGLHEQTVLDEFENHKKALGYKWHIELHDSSLYLSYDETEDSKVNKTLQDIVKKPKKGGKQTGKGISQMFPRCVKEMFEQSNLCKKFHEKFDNYRIEWCGPVDGQYSISMMGEESISEEVQKFIEVEFQAHRISFKDFKWRCDDIDTVAVVKSVVGAFNEGGQTVFYDIDEPAQKINICCATVDPSCDMVLGRLKSAVEVVSVDIAAKLFNNSDKQKIVECIEEGTKKFFRLLAPPCYRENNLVIHCLRDDKVQLEKKVNIVLAEQRKFFLKEKTLSVGKKEHLNILRKDHPAIEKIANENRVSVTHRDTDIVVKGPSKGVETFEQRFKELEAGIIPAEIRCCLEQGGEEVLQGVCSSEFVHLDKTHREVSNQDEENQQSLAEMATEEWIWSFPNGHSVSLALQDVRQCEAELHVVSVQTDSDTASMDAECNLHKKHVQLLVPQWQKGSKKEKEILREAHSEILNNALYEDFFKIAFEVCGSDWPQSGHIKQMVLRTSEYLKEEATGTPLEHKFCCDDSKFFKNCKEIFEKGMPKEAVLNKEVSQSGKSDSSKVTAVVISGDFVQSNADVLVNTTSKTLDLAHGFISTSLLKAAGQELQKEVQRIKPKGIDFWETLTTPAYNISGSKMIIHGALEPFIVKKEHQLLKKLQEFVIKCLTIADADHSTIAFPALGTGRLGYPPDKVAEAMFDAVNNFNGTGTSRRTKLHTMYIVIYDKDEGTKKKIFKNEQDLQRSLAHMLAQPQMLGKVQLQVEHGCLDNLPKSDMLVYFWDKHQMHTVSCKKNPDHHLLRKMGEKARKFWNEHRQGGDTKQPFTTMDHDLLCQTLLHVPVDNTIDAIREAIRGSVVKADVDKLALQSFYIDNHFTGACEASGIQGEKLLDQFKEVVSKLEPDLKCLRKITIYVENRRYAAGMVNIDIDNPSTQETQRQVIVEVLGFKENISQLAEKLMMYDAIKKVECKTDLDLPQNGAGAAALTYQSAQTPGYQGQRGSNLQQDNFSSSNPADVNRGSSNPADFNRGSSNPADVNRGSSNPADVNRGSSNPADVNRGSSNPADVNRGSSNPADFNRGSSNPADINRGSSNPADVNRGSSNPADVNRGSSNPADVNRGSSNPADVNRGSSNSASANSKSCVRPKKDAFDRFSKLRQGMLSEDCRRVSNGASGCEITVDNSRSTGNTLPADQSMDREATTKDNSDDWDNDMLEVNETKPYIVCVDKLESDTTIASLTQKMKAMFPNYKYQIVFCPGRTDAYLVCSNKNDADKMADTHDRIWKFRALNNQRLTKCRLEIPKEVVQDIDVHKLTELGVNMKTEADLWEFTAQTTYQLEFVKWTLTSNKDATLDITKVSEVGRLHWIVFEAKMSTQLKYFRSTEGCSIELDAETVIISMPLDTNLPVKELMVKLDELKQKEGSEELAIDDKDVGKVHGWCVELENALPDNCASVYDSNRKAIIALTDSYEDIKRVKHKLKVLKGEIEVKSARRGHRHGADQSAMVPSPQPFHYDVEKTLQKKFEWRRDASNVEIYKTAEFLSVYVYKASICNLGVDCIVNAANERLQHGGGVACAIAKAAGPDLTSEGDDYIRQNGPIPVGRACVTTAGNLPYKCVIHTVGPRWSDYVRTYDDKRQCLDALHEAVTSSFQEAEGQSLASIALPAISSAIFGVPEDLCVSQYVAATVDYSRKNNAASSLNEIHFVDINLDMIKQIQHEFHRVLNDGQAVTCNLDRHVKRPQQSGSSNSSQTYAAATRSGGSPNRDLTPSSVPRPTNAGKPFTMEVVDKDHFIFKLQNNASELHLHKGDLLTAETDAIVVVIDQEGNGGVLATSLRKLMEYKGRYDNEMRIKVRRQPRIGDVRTTGGCGSNFNEILHVVLPLSVKKQSPEQRYATMETAYETIFAEVRQSGSNKTLALTLLGIDTGRKEANIGAHMFIDNYLKHFLANGVPLNVHLVLREKDVFDETLSVFHVFVQEETNEPAASDNQAGSFDEDCVICMDKVEDRKVLPCGHVFCTGCIDQHFKFKEQCPTCGRVCGVITGDQPKGSMSVRVDNYQSCEGFDDCGKITITYNFYRGKQGESHPNPGRMYEGINRSAYLPCNRKGKEVCGMLKVAFKRRLIFTIGRSTTTGREGVITWNDIHHKTDWRSHSQFGYPDRTYLDRVTDELAAKGVTVADIDTSRRLEETINV